MIRKPYSASFLNKLVLVLMGLVGIYILVTSIYNNVYHPLLPRKQLIAALTEIEAPEGSVQLGEISFIDRQTFYYATKRYSSSKSIAEITNDYVSIFRKSGWRYIRPYVPGDSSSEFCKGELLGTLSFPANSINPVYYSIEVTTGGTETRTCSRR